MKKCSALLDRTLVNPLWITDTLLLLLLIYCLCVQSCRRGRPVLVREQRWAGVLGRRGPWGFHSGAPGARSPRHPWQEPQIPAWRPGGHAEGRRVQPEQLGPLGVLTQSNINPNCDPSRRWVDRLIFTNEEPASVVFWGGRQLLIRDESQPVLISPHCFSLSWYKEVATENSQQIMLKIGESTWRTEPRKDLMDWTMFWVSAWFQNGKK